MILVFLVKSGSATLKTAPVVVDIGTTYSRTECPRGAVVELVGLVLHEDVSVGCTTAPTVFREGGSANGLTVEDAAVVLGGSASIGEDDETEAPEVVCPRQSSSIQPSS